MRAEALVPGCARGQLNPAGMKSAVGRSYHASAPYCSNTSAALATMVHFALASHVATLASPATFALVFAAMIALRSWKSSVFVNVCLFFLDECLYRSLLLQFA